MDKYIYDESNGLWYELQGDYYIPYAIMNLIYGIALHLLIWSSIRTGKDYIDCSLCEIKTDYTGGN